MMGTSNSMGRSLGLFFPQSVSSVWASAVAVAPTRPSSRRWWCRWYFLAIFFLPSARLLPCPCLWRWEKKKNNIAHCLLRRWKQRSLSVKPSLKKSKFNQCLRTLWWTRRLKRGEREELFTWLKVRPTNQVASLLLQLLEIGKSGRGASVNVNLVGDFELAVLYRCLFSSIIFFPN